MDDEIANAAQAEGLQPPSREQLARYAEHQHLKLPEGELASESVLVAGLLQLLDRLDELEQPGVPLRFPNRDPGRPPRADEDPYNAIIRFCEVKGAESGPLGGMRIAVKDNIAVAKVPMTCGQRSDSPFVPTEDAVVVERVLEAGATIVAKTNLNGPTDFGMTRNPRNPLFSSGGSSSGSAAAVAAGWADAALGADQGGSIRLPSALCGLVGMKATHGLVPTYGMQCWDHTVDYVGPMTTTVADNAAMLGVLAGDDWRDPQLGPRESVADDYRGAAGLGVEGLRIGVVSDALEPSECTPTTLEGFRLAQKALARLGATVVPVSVPLWTDALSIWFACVAAGATATDDSLGQGHTHLGRVDLDWLAAKGDEHARESRMLPFIAGRTLPLVVQHLRYEYAGIPLGKAQNLRLELRRQIDELFTDVDLLITPTTPIGPPEIAPARPPSPENAFRRTTCAILLNTCPLNLTGHPALTVPSYPGDDDLPRGLQIVGRRFDERTVYRAGFAFEAEKPSA